MEINFKKLTIETFDANLNGAVKTKLTFRKIQSIKDKDASKLGDHLRSFVTDRVKNGTIPFPAERSMMFAMVKDSTYGEISCLIKPEPVR